jgi:hypothetical protein
LNYNKMSDKTDEAGVSHVPIETPPTTTAGTHGTDLEQHPAPEQKPGWKYRKWFGKLDIYYASPKVQLTMVAFVCFLCPGMFNALGGMGGGGKADRTLADNMVISLNAFIS